MRARELTGSSMRRGIRKAAENDPRLKLALKELGYPQIRQRDPGFETLLNIIIGQQLSTHAANAIWDRLENLIRPFTPDNLLMQRDESLRAVGLSKQKIAYAQSLAHLVNKGLVDFKRIANLDDEAAASELMQIRGVGRWTADIYLLFALGRRDVWPVDDLALVVATQRLYGMRLRPSRKRLLEIGRAWQPWRGAVSIFLWKYYRTLSSK
ncbi:MAG: DNA-3-methyladenine glycosylase 2 family protein [Leptospirales bacterium]|nr:DNA-3-methyladenine glycosylase 2 family protein [Leptospirales bacterium]